MRIILVSFDLLGEGHNYRMLFDKLRNLEAVNAMPSLWLLKSIHSPAQINADLLSLLGDQDRLLVIEVTGSAGWAATRLLAHSGLWLKAHRP